MNVNQPDEFIMFRLQVQSWKNDHIASWEFTQV